jgi:hypothetical protein
MDHGLGFTGDGHSCGSQRCRPLEKIGYEDRRQRATAAAISSTLWKL